MPIRCGAPGEQTCDTIARSDFRFAAMVLMVSGAAALGHEILWTRRMMDLLGASGRSSARVFGCFFLGLSLGAAGAALVLPRIRRHWLVLGSVEVGVAILCLPALLLPAWTRWIWPTLGPEGLSGWQGWTAKTALSFFILVPPALLMGMSLPVMVSAVSGHKPNRPGRETLLYAANTLGGAFGLLIVVLVALQPLGQAGSMLLMIALNLFVGALCFARHRRRRPALDAGTERVWSSAAAVAQPFEGLGLFLAFFSGAGVLALEVLGIALANLSAPLTIYPQAGILVCVILLLAVAAWVVAQILSKAENPVRLLSLGLAGSGVAVALVPILFMSLPGVRSSRFGYGQGFEQFFLRLTGETLLALGPAVLLAGSIFPCLIFWRGGGGVPGRRIGLLLALNGLGGIAGAETAYAVLLPSFAVHVSIGVVGACYTSVALGVLLILRPGRTREYAFPLVALLGVCYLTGAFLTRLPVYYRADTFKVIALQCGREGSLAVAEDGRGARAMILDNQYTLGGSAATPSLRRQAHLPLLFHPAPSNVAFLGLGTGITASGALEHSAVKTVTAIELSPLVAASAARDFSQFNHDVCRDPRARILVEDARIYLEAARDRFDVIVGDLFTPWRPGEASLSSFEEFRAAREALRRDGVFCQWIELTQWTPGQFQVAAATFRKAFGHLYVFRTGFKTDRVPIGLLGFKRGAPDWTTVARRCESEARPGHLLDPVCRHPEGVAMLYLGEYTPPPESQNQFNTLGNLRIELSAGRQLVSGEEEAYYSCSRDPWRELAEGQLRLVASRKELPDSLLRYPEAGLLATAFEIAVESGDNNSARARARDFLAQMPASVRADSAADWSLWPGTALPWEFLGVARPGTHTETPQK